MRAARSLPTVPPGWVGLGDTTGRVVGERDPGSVIVELPDATDEGGVTLGGPWPAVIRAVMNAALGYACPELLTPGERRIMVDRWEAVFGPLRPANQVDSARRRANR